MNKLAELKTWLEKIMKANKQIVLREIEKEDSNEYHYTLGKDVAYSFCLEKIKELED